MTLCLIHPRLCSPEAMDSLQLLLQHLLGGGDELQRADEL